MYCPELIDIFVRTLAIAEIEVAIEAEPAAREKALLAVAGIRAGGTTFNEPDDVRVTLDAAFDTHRLRVWLKAPSKSA